MDWIDYKEFGIYSALVGREQFPKKVEYCFRIFDQDGSGSLDKKELSTLLKAVARCTKVCMICVPLRGSWDERLLCACASVLSE